MKFTFILIFVAGIFASSTQNPEYIKDIDGNKYEVFEHNGYLIMAENLRTSRFRDGSKIQKTNGYKKWEEGINSKQTMYCFFEQMKTFVDEGGYLYSPAAITSEQGLAPEGWHIPTYEEWQNIFFEGDKTEVHNIYSMTWDYRKEEIKKAKKNKTELHISRKFGALGSGYRKKNGNFPTKEFRKTFLATAEGDNCFKLKIIGAYDGGAQLLEGLPSPDAGMAVRCVRKLD